ncbi:MAG: hypothetical protein ABJA66_22055, partial [Actinomycetota bacterium]
TTNQKESALQELESVQPLVNPQSRPLCLRSQFLLGSLYRDAGETDKTTQTFQKFLDNSQSSTDAEIKNYRQQLGVK